jgi:putative ABC transport system permease protein
MRFYRLLLRLYPAWFRVDYEEEMCGVFAGRRAQDGSLAAWIAAFQDLMIAVPQVHLDALRQDLRWTARVLRQSPGFTATAVLVTALGIGASTASFTLLDYVLVRPLPFSDPGSLVQVNELVSRPAGPARNLTSPPNFVDWVASTTSFASVGAYVVAPLSVNLSGHNDPQRLETTLIQSDVFRTLGVTAAAGRTFSPADDAVGGPDIAILSHPLAVALFGSASAAVGNTIDLDNASHVVVGVMPPDFAFPRRDVTIWKPLRFTPALLASRSNHILYGIARLRSGVSLRQAQAELDTIGSRLRRSYPKENAQTSIQALPLRDVLAPESRTLIHAIFAAALCLLLIACTNLANLFFARALARRPEIDVRIAIGAARERLIRLFLTESLAIAIAGGALGLLFALVIAPSMAALVPSGLPLGGTPEIDWRVFSFAAATTLLTSIVFGIGPAFRSSCEANMTALRSRVSAAHGMDRIRAALVTIEITGTVVLLVGVGLLLEALWHVQRIDPGFRAEGVLTLRTALPSPKFDSPEARSSFYSRVLDQTRALQGVSSAAYVSYQPMEQFSGRTAVTPPGYNGELQNLPRGVRHFVTPGFFETLDIPLRGRDFNQADTRISQPVAIISDSLARQLWPGQDAIGRTVQADGTRTIVGVAKQIAVRSLEGAADSQVYYPAEQMTMPSYYWPKDLMIRASGNLMALAPPVRRIIHGVDPQQAISNLITLQDIVEGQTTPRRTQLAVLATFAAMAFFLAAIGIYGLLSFEVTARRREVGVRIALGAEPSHILGMFLRRGLLLGMVGVVVAVPLAYAAARGISALLFRVQPGDPVVYATAGILATTMTLMGSLWPSFRAARIDPATTIRSD